MAQTLMILLIILCTCEVIRVILEIANMILTPKKTPAPTAIVNSAPQPPKADEEELARQRKKFDEEMEAFQQMLNYNADVAYGVEPKGE